MEWGYIHRFSTRENLSPIGNARATQKEKGEEKKEGEKEKERGKPLLPVSTIRGIKGVPIARVLIKE